MPVATTTPTIDLSVEDALGRLRPDAWGKTSPAARIALLREVRDNAAELGDELAAADAAMKNELMGENLYDESFSKIATVVPIANTLTACIELYEHLDEHGSMPRPVSITPTTGERFDIDVSPQGRLDKLLAAGRQDLIRVVGQPVQLNPLEKPAGIIAVLGAGNYSSALEMVKAMFLENTAVVHKPHKLNTKTDRVWAKIFQPLVEVGALSFLESDPERILNGDSRLSKIYFTGGTSTAMRIMESTDTELVSECGGNNPCLIVPGDRPWTDKELQHQAIQLVSIAKFNGGAVCGRLQTIVTSKQWDQREAFLDALRKAIAEDTPAEGTYYPGSDEVNAGFLAAHPNAEILHPEGGKYDAGQFVFIPGVSADSHSIANEAFSQVINEIALDAPAEPGAFLAAATAFCNDKLLGTLAAAIIIDDDTKKAHSDALDQALADLRYGAIGVNAMPPFIFLNPYQTWGGNEVGHEFVSGHGNFGNVLGFENVEKSIMIDSFMSQGHMLVTNKSTFDELGQAMASYAVKPGLRTFMGLSMSAVRGNFRKKDF